MNEQLFDFPALSESLQSFYNADLTNKVVSAHQSLIFNNSYFPEIFDLNQRSESPYLTQRFATKPPQSDIRFSPFFLSELQMKENEIRENWVKHKKIRSVHKVVKRPRSTITPEKHEAKKSVNLNQSPLIADIEGSPTQKSHNSMPERGESRRNRARTVLKPKRQNPLVSFSKNNERTMDLTAKPVVCERSDKDGIIPRLSTNGMGTFGSGKKAKKPNQPSIVRCSRKRGLFRLPKRAIEW
ncbi:hypothetical protein GPJ56_003974 [Histomonas meleagridis]|uniref:uncharacterized protein n=1 Tax=Histomonas meleagridis TaxID=135588 RepID=UPI0035598486|nr:hypothetical protein GPJ56_003974 [Histomonas meleagridis]KAH0798091.1 hypothetical protein GO595_009102 [Histomonas meleagridis]